MTTICTILALLLFPVLFLLWLTESRQQRARRWRRDGSSQVADWLDGFTRSGDER